MDPSLSGLVLLEHTDPNLVNTDAIPLNRLPKLLVPGASWTALLLVTGCAVVATEFLAGASPSVALTLLATLDPSGAVRMKLAANRETI